VALQHGVYDEHFRGRGPNCIQANDGIAMKHTIGMIHPFISKERKNISIRILKKAWSFVM
jgi:hypothetical protein